MRKSLLFVFAACLLFVLASVAFASSSDNASSPPVASADASKSDVSNKQDQTKVVIAFNDRSAVIQYWATVCITPYGTCPLMVAMQDGMFCKCNWPNGTWSTGYTQ